MLERAATTDTDRTLAPLHKVVSAEPVLTPAGAALVRAVADHYAGTFADVVRLAVPPRHAASEKAAAARVGTGRADGGRAGGRAGPEAGRAAGPARGLPRTGRRTWRRCAPGARRGRCGRSRRARRRRRTGRPASPRRPGPASRAAGARSCSRPTSATSPGSRPPASPRSAGPGWSRWSPRRARRPATGRSSPRCTAGRSVVVGNRAAAYAPVPRPRPGRAVGRRRRPVGRAARALPAHPRGAGAPGGAERGGGAVRLVRAHGRAAGLRRARLAAADRPGPGRACGTRRRGCG